MDQSSAHPSWDIHDYPRNPPVQLWNSSVLSYSSDPAPAVATNAFGKLRSRQERDENPKENTLGSQDKL